MFSITLRQLRDTRQLKRWLEVGHAVELRERNQVLAHIVPVRPAMRTSLPNFAERTRAIFGSRQVPSSQLLVKERRNAHF